MKVYINQANENWICDRMRAEFISHDLSLQITENPYEADVIWLLAGWAWNQLPLELLLSKKVVVTVHHIDPTKLDERDFLYRDQFVSFYHVPTEKTLGLFPASIDRDKITVIPYWYCESSWFSCEKRECRKLFGIAEYDLVIGSFQRDTEGSDLISPKLSKGPDTFCDTIEGVKPNVHVILAGWRRQYVISRLHQAGIAYTYFELLGLEDLNKLYNCLDLYLVTSRYEGGPQALLECAATSTPILSTNAGMATDVLSKKCIMNDSSDFVECINSQNFDFSEENYKKAQDFKLDVLYSQYINYFKSL